MRRGQTSLEFIFIFAFLVGISVILAVQGSGTISSATDQYRLQQAELAVERLVHAADSVYLQGPGAVTEVYITIPEGVNEARTFVGYSDLGLDPENRTININVELRYGDTDVQGRTKAQLNGTLPTTPGTYELRLFAQTSDLVNVVSLSEVVSVVEDVTPPFMTVVSPLNETYAHSVPLTISLNEAGSWCAVNVDGINYSMTKVSPTLFTLTNSTLDIESQHYASFSCNDTDGNMRADYGLVYFNVTRPVTHLLIEPLVYSNNSAVNAGADIQFNVTNLTADLSSVWYSIDGGVTNTSFCVNLSGEWFNESFAYRKTITIDSSLVDGDLTDFALFVNISDPDLALHSMNGGEDITFTDENNNLLWHEDEASNISEGIFVAWVNVPFISSVEDTSIYMYYGADDAPHTENASGVWDSDYIFVLHMNETQATTVEDSSGNTNHFTCTGGDCPTANIPSPMGKGLDFDGAGDVLVDVDGWQYINGLTAFTYSGWVKSDVTLTDKGFFIAMEPDGSDNVMGMRYDAAGAFGGGTDLVKMGITVETGTGPEIMQLETASNTQTTSWHYLVMQWSSGETMSFFSDGEQLPTTYLDPAQSGYINGSTIVYLGQGAKDTTATDGWDGQMDEMRLSGIKRSAAWINATFRNQFNTSAFYTITEEQTSGVTCSNFTVDTDGWAEGEYTITVWANDTDGNINETHWTFTIDNSPPKFSLFNVVNGSEIIKSDTIAISVDDNNLASKVWTNDSWATNYTRFNISASGFSYGHHIIGVYAEDAGGQANQTYYEFDLVDFPPTVDLTSPDNEALIDAGLTLEFDIGDVNGNLDSAWWSNGSGAANHSFAVDYDVSTTGWSVGRKDVYVWANDSSGNLNETVWTVYIGAKSFARRVVHFGGTTGTATANVINFTALTGFEIENTSKAFHFISYNNTGTEQHADVFKSSAITSPTELTVYGDSSGGALDIPFEATIIEMDPTSLIWVQPRTLTMTTGPTLPVIDTFNDVGNLSQTMINNLGHTHNAGETTTGCEEYDRIRLTGTTTWEYDAGCAFNSAGQDNRVEIVDWNDDTMIQSVQRGLLTMATTDLTAHAKPQIPVGRNNTLLFISYSVSTGYSWTPAEGGLFATLNSTGDIVIERAGTAQGTTDVAWELVEFQPDDVEVQHMVLEYPALTGTVLGSVGSVDYDKSAAFGTTTTPFGQGAGSSSGTTAGAVGDFMFTVALLDSTSVQVSRGLTVGAGKIGVQVMEFVR